MPTENMDTGTSSNVPHTRGRGDQYLLNNTLLQYQVPPDHSPNSCIGVTRDKNVAFQSQKSSQRAMACWEVYYEQVCKT